MYKSEVIILYISTDIAERIKKKAKESGLALREILQNAELGQNTMSHMKTSMLKADSLAKIADCLDCSVDYLLGRTENAKSHQSDNYPQEFEEFINKFAQLDEVDKIKITERMDTLLDDEKYKKYISAPKEA